MQPDSFSMNQASHIECHTCFAHVTPDVLSRHMDWHAMQVKIHDGIVEALEKLTQRLLA